MKDASFSRKILLKLIHFKSRNSGVTWSRFKYFPLLATFSAERCAEQLWILDKSKKLILVTVPTALYGAESWGMRSAEKRKVNVLEMKCLRSLVEMSLTDRVKNEDVRRTAV